MKKHLTLKLLVAIIICSGCTQEHSDASDTNKPLAKSAEHSYVPEGWLSKTLPEIAEGLRSGKISSESLTEQYLERIASMDSNGPTLQSVLAINPDALTQARAADKRRASGELTGPLHGVPILIKDNIETRDPLPTTAGSLALKNNITHRDSPAIAGLRAAGAIILGKANLSEWANFRSRDSISGWSAMGGQTRNPHVLDRNSCGSSSGSAVAVAASLTAGAVGTETNGSIICPSSINGVVGFKPTVGLVSQKYIVPISSSQDTAGPMAKSVTGVAMLLSAMAPDSGSEYEKALNKDSLQKIRIGVLRYSQGDNPDVNALFNQALAALERAGAILVNIDENPGSWSSMGEMQSEVLSYEFKTGLNDYLQSTPDSVQVRTLQALIAFNRNHAEMEMPLFDQSLLLTAQSKGGLDDAPYREALTSIQKTTRSQGIDHLLAHHNVSVLVAPSGPMAPLIDPVYGDTWPIFPGAGFMAAIAGYPHLTVPAGTAHHLPVGLSFIGGHNQDAAVLSYGYAYEQHSNQRAEPQYLSTVEASADVAAAMAPSKQ